MADVWNSSAEDQLTWEQRYDKLSRQYSASQVSAVKAIIALEKRVSDHRATAIESAARLAESMPEKCGRTIGAAIRAMGEGK